MWAAQTSSRPNRVVTGGWSATGTASPASSSEPMVATTISTASRNFAKATSGEGTRIAVEPDASVRVSGVMLDQVGEQAVVNTTPELHNHPAWQFAAPGGDHHPADRHLSIRLHADGFESSDEIPITLSVFEGGDGGDHH